MTSFNPGDRVSFEGVAGTVERRAHGDFICVLFDAVRDSDVDDYYNYVSSSLLERMKPEKQQFKNHDFPVGATFTEPRNGYSIRKATDTRWEFTVKNGTWVTVNFAEARDHWINQSCYDWEYEVIPPQTRSKIRYADANWELS